MCEKVLLEKEIGEEESYISSGGKRDDNIRSNRIRRTGLCIMRKVG